MHLPKYFFALPGPLLVLLLSSIPNIQANDGLPSPASINYPRHQDSSENRSRRRKAEAAQEHILAGHAPIAIKKMSEDEGEMFFPEYWGFKEMEEKDLSARSIEDGILQNLRREYTEDDERLLGKASTILAFRPAFAPHENYPTIVDEKPLLPRVMNSRKRASEVLAILQKRGFQCPTGTTACTSISQPNYCCGETEDCFSITDTGLGPVGCCPKGKTCSGDITSCASGNSACPKNMGGACCIPGFTCFDVGCIKNVSVTIIVTVDGSTSTQPATSTSSQLPLTITVSSTTTRNPPPSTSTTPKPSTSTSTVITTASALPPVKGTSISDSPTTTVPSSTAIISGDACPTGFYACSAYYPGAGCCRVDRNCAATFCPSTASIVIVSSGVTVAVPLVPSATTTAVGSCASGWFGCAADVGNGCCPSGFECGTTSCSSAGATATVEVGKGQANFLNGATSIKTLSLELGLACLGLLLFMFFW